MPDWLSWLWANREEIVRLLTLVGGAIGIYFLAVRTRAADRTARASLDQAKIAADQAKTAAERHNEQTRADRERRITESFAKAVEQLGSDKLETRLGAIYMLERISREKHHENDSEPEYYWPIMETLTAYVREHALGQPRRALANPFGGEIELKPWPTTDIQAVLTVLGRRDETGRKQDEAANRHLDLAAMDLRGANLRGAHLEGAILAGGLEGASFWEAHLKGATLMADLKGANFRGSDLEGANLRGAHLEGANLRDAYLKGADLEGANLSKAHIEGVDLRDVAGLTQEQVNSALGNEETRLPEGLTPPPHWPSAPPDEQPPEPDRSRIMQSARRRR